MDKAAPNLHMKKSLGLFDIVCIIVGMIIGSGIFGVPTLVAQQIGSSYLILLAWFLGGVLSLVGAMCYAELATAYPHAGGDYWYLNRAYGRWCGFLFAWTQLIVIRTGNTATMAYVFSEYATKLYAFPESRFLYAIAAVIILTGIHCVGVREGKLTQNLLTTAKVIGLTGVVMVALFVKSTSSQPGPLPVTTFGSFFLAMIFIQFTYGGWQESAYVASEVRNPSRNLLLSLFLGSLFVTVIYVTLNAMLLWVAGPVGVAGSETIFADILSLVLGNWGSRLVSVLVMISTLGSLSAILFTSARINFALGSDHSLFSFMSRYNERTGSPVTALLIQGGISLIMICSGGMQTMIEYTAAASWVFFILTGVSLFVLRYKDRDIDRPYRVHFYPLLPLLFIASSGMLLYSSLVYAGWGSVIGFVLVLAGLPVYWVAQKYNRRPATPDAA